MMVTPISAWNALGFVTGAFTSVFSVCWRWKVNLGIHACDVAATQIACVQNEKSVEFYDMSVCVNHTNRTATSRCSSCHKPICNDCIVNSGGAVYCSNRCAEGAAKFSKTFKSDTGPGFFGNLKNTIVGLVGLAFLFIVVVYIGGKFLNIGIFKGMLKMFGL